MRMQTNVALLIVIGFLLILTGICLGIITYLAKRILDEKPITIKEMAQPGQPPEVTTRADLKVAREYVKEKNFETQPDNNLVDLDQIPADIGMASLEKFNETWGDK